MHTYKVSKKNPPPCGIFLYDPQISLTTDQKVVLRLLEFEPSLSFPDKLFKSRQGNFICTL